MDFTADQTTLWLGRIQHAWRIQQRHHPRWREAAEMVDGTWLARRYGLDDNATAVNIAWAYVRGVTAAIYARNPYTFVEAEHAQFVPFAHSMERVLNYLKRELNLKRQIKQATIDAQITGIGWVETGFTATFGTLDPSRGEEAALRRLMEEGKRPERQGMLNEYVKEISAYAIRRSSYNVLLAPGYPDVSSMPYLIVGEDFAPEDFAAHPLFKRLSIRPTRTMRQDAGIISTPQQPTAIIPMSTGPSNGFGRGDQVDFIRTWNVWNRRGQERGVFFEGSQASMGPFKWRYCLEGFPLVPLIFNWLPETERITNAYPIGDITPMIPQLRELSLLRTAMTKHRKRSGTLIMVPETLATAETLQALKTGDDVSIVVLKDTTGVVNHSPPALPPDLYRIDPIIKADLDIVGGFSQIMLASPPAKGDRTATEVRAEGQVTGFRTSEKIDLIEEFSVEIDRRLAAVAWEFYPRERIREILGEPILTESLWPSLPEDPQERCEIIERELRFRIRAGSTQPIKDRTLRNEQRLRFANVVAGIAPELIKRSELIRQLAEDLEFSDAQSFLITEDQQELKTIQEENRLLLQGIPQIVGPNEPHTLHISGHEQGIQQGQSTPAMDQHILMHGQHLRAKNPHATTQQGDAGGTRGVASSPEAMRQGSPDQEDLEGALGRILREPGTQHGGVRAMAR